MITTKDHNGETVTGVLTTFGTRTDHGVRIMSDVWADITYAQYLDATGEVREVAVYNSEFPGSHGSHEVDASAEVKSAALAVLAARNLAVEAASLVRHAEAARKALADVTRKGRTVKVTAKRAKGSGNVGVVFWSGDGQYGVRLGMKLEGTGETFWTAARNCTVVSLAPDESEADVIALEAEAEEACANAASAAKVARENAIAAVAATLEVTPF